MSAVSWISFGPDLEPLEIETRRRADAPEPRADGLLVAGDPGEIAATLAEASSGSGWCRLEHVDAEGARQVVHVHAQHVRFVAPAASGNGAAPG